MHSVNQELVSINIIFGGACNLKCPYCLQSPEMNNKKGDPKFFLENFKKFVEKKKIKSVKSIHYWGGEPLLYWKNIRDVYLGMTEIFPDCKIHRMTTNGTLVDDAYVDFCNEHKNIVNVVSLHDSNMSDEQWTRLGRLNRLCLSGLVHHLKRSPYDYMGIWERIYGLTGRELPIGLYQTHATDGCASEYWLTKEDVDFYFEEMLGAVLPMANMGHKFSQKLIANIKFECDGRKTSKIPTKCFNDRILSIDLLGNQFYCHHNNIDSNRVQNIFNGTIYLSTKINQFCSDECDSCEAFTICKGGCFMSNKHDVECYWEKAKWNFYKTLEERLKNAI